MPLSSDIKFQKALALAASASNVFEAEAAELAVRRLMIAHNIDPTDIPNQSLYNRTTFTDNALLKKLREEWRELHPLPPPKESGSGRPPKLEGPTIPFNISGFRKTLNRNRKYRGGRAGEPRDETRVEKLRQLLNSGKSRPAICREEGFNQGEISGIIRDYTGAKSAAKQFQDNPKWTVQQVEGRTFYELAAAAVAGAGGGEAEGRSDEADPAELSAESFSVSAEIE